MFRGAERFPLALKYGGQSGQLQGCIRLALSPDMSLYFVAEARDIAMIEVSPKGE
jgi:hypothetical protein